MVELVEAAVISTLQNRFIAVAGRGADLDFYERSEQHFKH